jgi:fructuronate reductase
MIGQVFTPFLNRHLNVVMPAAGDWAETLVASITAAHPAGAQYPGDWAELQRIAAAPSLQIISLTITEKGYTTAAAGSPDQPADAMETLTALLLARFQAGGNPLAVLATDNFSRNGDRCREAVLGVARAWQAAGLVAAAFTAWLEDKSKLAFPLSMVDRITPNPSPQAAGRLAAEGWEGTDIIPTGGVPLAPFANTEDAWYLVIEDDFPNGRPPFERAGVYIGGRDTVNAADEMKVTVCLNPLHTALAVFGLLLGFPTIAQEMTDPALVRLVRRLGYDEGLPVCPDPGVLNPKAFLDEVVERRLPNPNLPDTPGRIAQDTSQKLPIRFGETLKKYLAQGLPTARLTAIPLVLAAWLRYLLGVDDAGRPLQLSPDPRLAEVQARLAGLSLGRVTPDQAAQAARLVGEVVGVDLAAAGLEQRVAADFLDLAAGPGAVRATLQSRLEGPAR